MGPQTPEPGRDLPGSMFRDGTKNLTALGITNVDCAPQLVKNSVLVLIMSGVRWDLHPHGLSAT